jgi:hypothetical protein
MLHTCIQRFDVMSGRGNILSLMGSKQGVYLGYMASCVEGERKVPAESPEAMD